jgi:ankyrin repeat protein
VIQSTAERPPHNHPLLWTHGNQKKVAEVLLARGADLKARNISKRTPLGETEVHRATAVAKLLQAAGAPAR